MTYLSASSVSEQLHRSVRWVYLYAAELGAVRIGGTWIFTQEGLDNAISKSWGLESGSKNRGPKENKVVSIEKGRSGLGKRNKERVKNTEILDKHGIAASFHGAS